MVGASRGAQEEILKEPFLDQKHVKINAELPGSQTARLLSGMEDDGHKFPIKVQSKGLLCSDERFTMHNTSICSQWLWTCQNHVMLRPSSDFGVNTKG